MPSQLSNTQKKQRLRLGAPMHSGDYLHPDLEDAGHSDKFPNQAQMQE